MMSYSLQITKDEVKKVIEEIVYYGEEADLTLEINKTKVLSKIIDKKKKEINGKVIEFASSYSSSFRRLLSEVG